MKKTIVEKHFDKIAKDYDYYKNRNSFYYENLKKLLCSLIPANEKVFEVGCGTGDLLTSLKPKIGYGMDISRKMIRIAKYKQSLASQGPGKYFKNIEFSTKWPSGHFDYIFMSDVIEHLEDPLETFKMILKLMDRDSEFVITMANPFWEPLLIIWEKLGWKMPEGPHERIRYKDIKILSKKAGMKIVKHDYKLLIPVKIPLLTNFVNKYLEKPLKKLAFIEYFVVAKS